MDFVKGLFDSDKESESGSARKSRKKMNEDYEKADKYNDSRKKTKSGDNEIDGVPRRPKRSNKVEPMESEAIPFDHSIPMENMDNSEERVTMPPRSKSRAVMLPSGLIIGSEDDSSVHTSSLSSHSSDSFNPKNKLVHMVGLEVEDVENGKLSYMLIIFFGSFV